MNTTASSQSSATGRMKFIVGGVLILAAVVYLIISSTASNSQYYMTVEELMSKSANGADRDVRVSGAVLGETIAYEPETLTLRFTVVNVPGDLDEIEKNGGLAEVLHEAVTDPTRTRMEVVYVGPKPDLLQNEAQAIMTGRMGDDGVFYAEELLLKCPTRYDESIPSQADG